MGTIINASLTETNRAAQAIRYLVEFITKSALCIALIILLLMSNTYLTLIILVIVFILFIIFRNTIVKFSSSAGNKRLILSQEHTEKCTEMIGAIKEAKILNLQNKLLDSFDRSVTGYSKINIIFNFFTSIPQILSEFILVFLFSFSLIVLSFYSYDLSKVIPMLALYLVVSIRLVQTFSLMTMLRMRYIGLLPSVLKVTEYLSETLKQEKEGGLVFSNLETDIQINSLSFSYEKKDDVLDNVNLLIPKKNFTGIIGESGSGKSTFVNILTCLLFPTKGEIIINNKNLVDYNIDSWRRKIGYVSQTPFLFNDSIYNNILMGSPNVSEKEIALACESANALNFIEKLPDGFNTIVGDRGSVLSGGQLQRIAIARAIVRKPDLFIFDECTSALDIDSENLIVETIKSLSKKHTVIAITHKLDILKDADYIYEVKNKKIERLIS
jgi:ABC-type bacteriocin/lantibiotic exporter with double-glycine peptidase domain